MGAIIVLLLWADWPFRAGLVLACPPCLDDLTTSGGCVSDWEVLATGDSVCYRLVRAFATATAEYLLEPITMRAAKVIGESSGHIWDGAERPVWALLEARPPHLLNSRFASYKEFLQRSADEVVNQLRSVSGGDLGRAT